MKSNKELSFVEIYNLEDYVVFPERDIPDFSNIPERMFGVESEAYRNIKDVLRTSASEFYPLIDLSFFEGMNSDVVMACHALDEDFFLTLPKFAIYSLDNPEFEMIMNAISYKERGIKYIISPPLSYQHMPRNPMQANEYHYKPNLAKLITSSIRKVGNDEMVRKIFNKRGISDYSGFSDRKNSFNIGERYAVTIGTTFTDVIPKQTREKIQRSLKIFDETDIYLVTEAKNWSLVKERLDPLVIAISDDDGFGYLIDQFYTTPIEDYVAREFTRKK